MSRTISKKNTRHSKGSIHLMDVRTQKIQTLGIRDFRDELRKIRDEIVKILSSIDQIGRYQLKRIDISVGASAGILVVTVEGGITFSYESTN